MRFLWLLRRPKNYGATELTDAQISKLIGTTKPTIGSVRDRTHWNSPNIKPQNPVGLGLCSEGDLEKVIAIAPRAGAHGAWLICRRTRITPIGEATPASVAPAKNTVDAMVALECDRGIPPVKAPRARFAVGATGRVTPRERSPARAVFIRP